MLLKEGLLRSTAHRGVMVFKPSVGDLIELYEIRIRLEVLATEKAVMALTSDDHSRLGRILTEMEKADIAGEFDSADALNHDFHIGIYSASRMPRLITVIEEMRQLNYS